MAMVMLVLLTLILGSVAIAGRTTGGLLGANLQSRNREARDVAEAGIVEIVGELNKERNRALLVAGNTGAWDSTQVNPCTKYDSNDVYDSTSTGTPPTAKAQGYETGGWNSLAGSSNQEFQLENVNYTDTLYDDYDTPSADILTTGVSKSVISLTINGRITDSAGNVLSTSRVTRQFLVVPKCCRRSFGRNQFSATSFGPDTRSCLAKDSLGNSFMVGLNGGALSSSNNSINVTDANNQPITKIICNSTPLGGGSPNANCTNNVSTLGKVISAVPTPINLAIPAFPGTSTLWPTVDAGGNSTYYIRVDKNVGPTNNQVQLCTSNGTTVSGCNQIMNSSGPGAAPACSLVTTSYGGDQYFCRLGSIDIKKDLVIDTSNAPINIYFDSSSATASTEYINFQTGNSTIGQVYCGGGITNNNVCPTAATIGSAGDRLNLFSPTGVGKFEFQGGNSGFVINIYAPYAAVSFNGTASLSGRIWANQFYGNGNTSYILPVTSPLFCGASCPGTGGSGNPDIDWVARSVIQSSAF